jgi:hypothetical protein
MERSSIHFTSIPHAPPRLHLLMSTSRGSLHHQSGWPATVAVLVIVGLQLSLLEKLTLGPTWLAPLLELALLVPLSIVAPRRHPEQARVWRYVAIGLIGLINISNFVSLGLLVHFLITGGKTSGGELLFDAVKIWVTNVILFALWYWELDRGGPHRRGHDGEKHPDFAFAQMTSSNLGPANWQPVFLDYLFVSFTNGSAFSPTDTLPLTGRAKLLMMLQALTSLLTVALIAGRAVNILP